MMMYLRIIGATIMDTARFEIFYKTSFFNKNVRWYWRLRAHNGEIVAIGAEPFDSHSNVMRAIATMKQHATTTMIDVV